MKVFGHRLIEERVFGRTYSRLGWSGSSIEPEQNSLSIDPLRYLDAFPGRRRRLILTPHVRQAEGCQANYSQ